MHTHFTKEERVAVATLRKAGFSVPRIAEEIGKHHTSVYREIARNRSEKTGYHPGHAERRARKRREESKDLYRKIDGDPDLQKRIEALLHPLRSPEVVAHICGVHH